MKIIHRCVIVLVMALGVSNLHFFRKKGLRREMTVMAQGSEDVDTTIIITSNLIPTHPSLVMIDTTIASLQYLHGLPETTPVVITIDGVRKRNHEPNVAEETRLRQYILALSSKYNNSHITVLPHIHHIHLLENVRRAVSLVQTEFMYILQHDMPFIADINHPSLVHTLKSHPDEVRLVRFGRQKTLSRQKDKLGLCGDVVDFEAHDIGLSKTHTWSDNNHFTRKAYYQEMFEVVDWEGIRCMEKRMNELGHQNCSYWGTYLYGRQGDVATITHLDGRRTTNETTFSLPA